MQRLILLRGVMASGKSTIAKRYRNFSNKTAWLKIDNFKDFFSDTYPEEVRDDVHAAAIATLEYMLQKGFTVVMEGVLQNSKYIDMIVQIANEYHVPFRVFELHVSLATLQKRDKTREGVPEGLRPALGDEEIALVYERLKNSPYEKAIVLNTETLSIDECILAIDKAFS